MFWDFLLINTFYNIILGIYVYFTSFQWLSCYKILSSFIKYLHVVCFYLDSVFSVNELNCRNTKCWMSLMSHLTQFWQYVKCCCYIDLQQSFWLKCNESDVENVMNNVYK